MAKKILGKVSMVPKGTFQQGTVYNRLDLVNLLGSSYVSKVDNNTSVIPSANWMLVAARGEVGNISATSNLNITDPTPTAQGLYILSDVGQYTNLGKFEKPDGGDVALGGNLLPSENGQYITTVPSTVYFYSISNGQTALLKVDFPASITGQYDPTIKYVGPTMVFIENEIYFIDRGFVSLGETPKTSSKWKLVFSPFQVSDLVAGGDKPVSSGRLVTEFLKKQNKEDGKGLSEANFTQVEKNKLAKVLTNGDGKKVLNDLGEYVNMAEGGGSYNVTLKNPLVNAFHTLQSAVTSIASDPLLDKNKLPGTVMTFEVELDTWVDYRFIGKGVDGLGIVSNWIPETVKDVVKTISIAKGTSVENLSPNVDGNILITIPDIEVDASLNVESDNAIANSAVTTAINELDTNTVFSLEADLMEGDASILLSLKNKTGQVFASAEIPAGGGGSGPGGGSETTKIVINGTVPETLIKKDQDLLLSYNYDHQFSAGDTAGESTGLKGSVTITIKSGSVVNYMETFNNLNPGSYQLEIGKYLSLGSNDVYIKAAVTDTEGLVRTKQTYLSIKSYEISLNSTYQVNNNLIGFTNSETVSIPYAVAGVGTKYVSLYVNGVVVKTDTISKSGSTLNSFSLLGSSLATGRNTIQISAELVISPELSLFSKTVFFDVFKYNVENSSTRIALKTLLKEGTILDAGLHLSPTLDVTQYEISNLEYAVYTPSSTLTNLEVFLNGVKDQTIRVDRGIKKYNTRFTTVGVKTLKFKAGDSESNINIDVKVSSIQVQEVLSGLQHKFEAFGRSNSEQAFNEWPSGLVKPVFTGVDWNSSGWNGEFLSLTNGGKLSIPLKIFSNDLGISGYTFEFEFKYSNILKEGLLISSVDNGIGLTVTTKEAKISTSSGTNVSTKYAPNDWVKIAFVINKRAENKLMEIFINGVRCGAEQFNVSDSFVQETPKDLVFDSTFANIQLRNIRTYVRALTADEILSNFIVDRPNVDQLVATYNRNDVMDDFDMVSIDKLRAKGKSVMRIIGDVNLVNTTNNKKFEVPVNVYYFSSLGAQYDFVATNAGLRIQGTSSTTYPRKNYRIYLDRATKYGAELRVNGVLVPDFKYAFKPGNIPVNLFTMKADFAESSSTHNTGLAIIINDTLKRAGILTPPQEINYSVRTGIDGVPMDVFAGQTNDENNYIGKYNFNNDKASSGIVFGFEGIPGFNSITDLEGAANKCICLEFLNNSQPLGLFTSSNMAGFDEALEFRYPEDLTWATAPASTQIAVQRLWNWVKSCQNNPVKFKAEVANYFDVDSLTSWYILTEYFMMVDQRVKNMMLVTWDGLKWFFIPYDNDTILGVRNDGKLIHDYDIDEDSYDDSVSSYAFAGHDSVLWSLVRAGLKEDLIRVASTIRGTMSKEYVLEVMNKQFMSNWSEKIYNEDGEYKYFDPLESLGVNYLYSLQGTRAAHRSYMIENRFSLLDAKYLAGTYRADNLRLYLSHNFSTDNRIIDLMAAGKYYFGYGFTSGAPKQSGVYAEGDNSVVQLTFATDLIVNDPQYLYGASKIKEIDLRQISPFIINDLNFNGCFSIRKINISSTVGNTTLTGITVKQCALLEDLNVKGMRGTSFTNLDLSSNTRLLKLDARDTKLNSVAFAVGAPITEIKFPASLTSLSLRGLKNLTNAGITFEGTANIKQLIVEDCPNIDWEALLDMIPTITHIRVDAVQGYGNVSWLDKFINLSGIDEVGNILPYPVLLGEYVLNNYLDEAMFLTYKNRFPTLDFNQPEFTAFQFTDKVAATNNVTNLDNNTGYGTGIPFVTSGHVSKILSRRFGCVGKQTSLGNMSVFKLRNTDWNFYDVPGNVPSNITSANGDVYVYETPYWYRGVNFEEESKKFSLYSSNTQKPKDFVVSGTINRKVNVKELINLDTAADYADIGLEVLKNKKIRVDINLGLSIFNSDSSDVVIKFKVDNFKMLRVPLRGSDGNAPYLYSNAANERDILFSGENDTIISNTKIIKYSGDSQLEHTMKVPAGAKYCYIHFTTSRILTSSYEVHIPQIILSTSPNVFDMDPKWVYKEPTLIGAFLTTVSADSKLVSGTSLGIANGYSSTLATAEQFVVEARKLGLVDFEMMKDLNNLIAVAYGDRGWRKICGIERGQNEKIGTDTAKLGITKNTMASGGNYVSVIQSTYQEVKSKIIGYESLDVKAFITGLKRNAIELGEVTKKGNFFRTLRARDNEYYAITQIYHGTYMDPIATESLSNQGSYYYEGSARMQAGPRETEVLVKFGHTLIGYENKDATGEYCSRIAFRGNINEVTDLASYTALTPIG